MNRKIKLAGLEFELLTEAEAVTETKNCAHKWELSTKDIIINPGGEFVRGYGSGFVSVRIANGRRCSKCGLFETDKEVEKFVRANSDILNKALKLRPARNRTICQMLRELRGEVQDTAKVDACLVVAKKMNDKLVEYAGSGYTRGWYDADGNFIIEEND